MSVCELLRTAPGTTVDLSAIDPSATPGFVGDKRSAEKALFELSTPLADLQEKLFANGYVDDTRSLLVVVQGMDTSGKGGTLRHCVGIFDPGGVSITSFKRPTEEELKHDFLWRVEKAVPPHGYVAIFDRSHYEDVLVQRVHAMASVGEIERRYGAINDFEQRLADDDVTIVKIMLHISREEQKKRFLDRLDDPTKQWKYKPGDVDEGALWDEYMAAYEIALTRCSTDVAPWYVVPADRKWYRDWAVSTILLETLEGMGLEWPEPAYDAAAEKKRVKAS